jgi:hypothetical protein
MATGSTTKYLLPYPLPTDQVNVSGDIEKLAVKIDNILQEEIEDAAAAMWTGGTFSNGLTTPTYNDTTGKMSMSLAQDIQTTATPTFTGANLMGGDLYLGQSRTLIFEGSSNDSFKTTLTVANPTANRTITFQNVTGTVALTSESTLASLVNVASATGALTVQVGYGATTNGTTKTINIGGNGVSGSTTNINIGSAVSGALGTTTINSSSVSIPSSSISLGTVVAGTWSGTAIGISKGGTGLTSNPTNGQLLIGNGTGYTLSTITAGSGIIVTNSAGAITIAAEQGADVFPSQSGNSGKYLTTNGTAVSWSFIPQSSVTNLTSDLALKAPLASPTFTGTPNAPTASSSTNTTQIATTAFVKNNLNDELDAFYSRSFLLMGA